MADKKAGAKFVEVKASVAKQRGWRILSFVLDSETFDRIAFVSRRDDDKDAGTPATKSTSVLERL